MDIIAGILGVIIIIIIGIIFGRIDKIMGLIFGRIVNGIKKLF